MLKIEEVVIDRGSKYAVSGVKAENREDIKKFLRQLTAKKKYAKATHNSWAVVFKDGEQVKNDDGESGAGALMLKLLEQHGVHDQLVVVTRWYGGVRLGADRFRHIRTCVRVYLDELVSK